MIDMLHRWYKIDELMEFVSFVGVGRPGTIGETQYPITKLQIPEIDLSSTVIRNRVKTSRTIQFLVPSSIEEFIRQEGLYGNQLIDKGN